MAKYSFQEGHRYLDFDDVDDEHFLRSKSSGNLNKEFIDLKNDPLESRGVETLKSTERSLENLRNAEIYGIGTGEELLKQREQLERTSNNLDDINSSLRSSQTHIQGMKSVFYGLKNFFIGKSTKKHVYPIPPLSAPSSKLHSMMELNHHQHLNGYPHLVFAAEKTTERKTDGNAINAKVINENMQQVLESVKKLKVIATGLGEEIDTQNDLLEGVMGKAEHADLSLTKQNKDILKLLK
ncbi:soluble NSF attachment protein 29-like [Rhodnius prolixus]|uniref:t-SNARE coiled-coil homology domain-containing protein n=1 Tax=Rhodnius prolixus TaxID=13249 RepID=R4G5N5_RHOPR